MTDNQRQRVKSDLISGKLLEILAKANGKAHLWIRDNGSTLLFSTNPLSGGNGLIVEKLAIPSCILRGNRVADESKDAAKTFLKKLIGAESAEAEQIIQRSGQVVEMPKVRVRVTEIGSVLCVSGMDVNEVGTDGVLINGCRIGVPMEIVATIGGTATLRITLAQKADASKFELNKFYTLIYRIPSGPAIGILPVPPA